MKRVYLAGGKGDWRKMICKGIEFVDPMAKDESFMNVRDYLAWDLFAIRDCDAMLCYMENDNPSGIGMAVEIGYAKALGKLIIYVDGLTDDRSRYFAFARECGDVIYTELDESLRFLSTLK